MTRNGHRRKNLPACVRPNLLKGALLCVLIINDHKYARAAASEHRPDRTAFKQSVLSLFNFGLSRKYYPLEIVAQRRLFGFTEISLRARNSEDRGLIRCCQGSSMECLIRLTRRNGSER